MAVALLRDTRWDTPQAGPVPIPGQPRPPAAAVWHLVSGCACANRWWRHAGRRRPEAALPLCGGGSIGPARSGTGAIYCRSRRAVRPSQLIGLLLWRRRRRGIGAGLAVAESVLRLWRTAGTIAGGAIGGGLVALAVSCSEASTLEILEGVARGWWRVRGVDGSAPRLLSDTVWPHAVRFRRRAGSTRPARWRVALFTAVSCACGALAVSLTGRPWAVQCCCTRLRIVGRRSRTPRSARPADRRARLWGR